jgi:hypothetical protein
VTRGENDPERTYRTGTWSLKSNDVVSRADDGLDDHLRWLLNQLEPTARQLAEVVAEQELDAEFWCVVYMEAPNCDFGLRAETLGRIAALRASLRLDIYAPDDAKPEVIEIPEPSAQPEAADTRAPKRPDETGCRDDRQPALSITLPNVTSQPLRSPPPQDFPFR